MNANNQIRLLYQLTLHWYDKDTEKIKIKILKNCE